MCGVADLAGPSDGPSGRSGRARHRATPAGNRRTLKVALWQLSAILPQSVDTPIFRHSGNYTGRSPKPVPIVVDPQRVVRAILRSVEHPRRQRTVAWWGRLIEVGHGAMPGFCSRLVPTVMNRGAFSDKPAEPGPGNVFEPMPEWNQVEGG